MRALLLRLTPVFALLAAASPLRANYAVDPVAPEAHEIFKLFGLPITNSMVTTWVIAAIVIVAVRCAVGRHPKLVPERAQSVLEVAVEKLDGLVAPIVGGRVRARAFPLLFALFIYILIMNWSSLLPGVGTFGFYDAEGHMNYFFRPASSDLNTTLALAVVGVVGWLYFAFRYTGPKALAREVFGNKADRKTTFLPLYIFLGAIFLCVGCIELVSYFFRLVSLTFRLYGNVFGGETLLSNMFGLPNSVAFVPKALGWLCALPFYFLELLIGFVQALVFMLLTAVYIGVNCNHGEGHEEPHATATPKQSQ